MADVLFVAITIAFFLICVAYVNWCDRIIGPDDFGPTTASDDARATTEEAVDGSDEKVPA